MLDVARGQIERGHSVGIFCDSTTGGSRSDRTLDELRPRLALGLHRVPMRRLPHPLDVAALATLTRVYRATGANVLHGHGSKGGVFARLVTLPGRGAGTVRAYTPHGGSFNYHPGSLSHRIYMQAESVLARRTDAFLFESDFVRDRFETYVGGTDRPVRVVHNGISPAEFEPLQRDPDPFDLVYIGEFRPAKGVETLIDALALLRRESGRRLTLLVVGSGPSEPDLHARAKAAGVWDSTAFVPAQPVRAALARGRVMVIPSKSESLPYIILEAAAAAQPLVSTNVGGIGEIFGPYSDQLIPAGDPARLAGRILAKMDEPEAARHEAALALAEHVRTRFCIDRMVDGMLDGYAVASAAKTARRR